MAKPLPMERFRPNLVVRGTAPYEEDLWKRIRIGDVELAVVKPCSRCAIPTTDQETGERDGKEPLRTLATYRKTELGVVFGQNVVHLATGRSGRRGGRGARPPACVARPSGTGLTRRRSRRRRAHG